MSFSCTETKTELQLAALDVTLLTHIYIKVSDIAFTIRFILFVFVDILHAYSMVVCVHIWWENVYELFLCNSNYITSISAPVKKKSNCFSFQILNVWNALHTQNMVNIHLFLYIPITWTGTHTHINEDVTGKCRPMPHNVTTCFLPKINEKGF